MTTLVWDGRILAADGQTSTTRFVFGRTAEKLIDLQGIVYKDEKLLWGAFAGNCVGIEHTIEVLRGEREIDPEHTTSGIIVGETKVYYFDEEDTVLTPSQDKHLAAGSGVMFALSAME